MWVADTTSSVHNECAFDDCWIEIGYGTFAPGTSPNPSCNTYVVCYFWADNRPNGGYHEHDLEVVPSGDYGYLTDVYIWWQGASIWNVELSSNSGFTYENQSKDNPFNPKYIRVGTELAGTTGASSYPANFDYNQWEENGNWQYQTNSGTVQQQWPIVAYWLTPPASGNYGGDFYTCEPCA